jgi:hypothetical protein
LYEKNVTNETNGEEMMEESGVINAAFAYTVEGIFGTLDLII